MGATPTMDHWDVHVSLEILNITHTDIQTLDPTQAIGGRDRSRESSEAKRDDCHSQRCKSLSSML
jgi:hypothetical protein